MNFAFYFTAPWFARVLFLFVLFSLPIKEWRLLRFARNDTQRGLAMTVKEGSRW